MESSQPAQAVRFASKAQEFDPVHSLQSSNSYTSSDIAQREISPEAEKVIKSISRTFQDNTVRHRRMSNFAFEPVSVPVSRVSVSLIPHLNGAKFCYQPTNIPVSIVLKSYCCYSSTSSFSGRHTRTRNMFGSRFCYVQG